MLKVSTGNMYDWVTHTHSHLSGECPHKCSYCYVQRNRFGVTKRYKGKPRLIESEFDVNYGKGNVIFIEHMGDLFADSIPTSYICSILSHCKQYNDNTYIFQTKNPEIALAWVRRKLFPNRFIIGTTIETNINSLIARYSLAPLSDLRFEGIKNLGKYCKTFITVEPIMDFDEGIFECLIIGAKPDFVNIGADSKGCNLLEPSKDKIISLIKRLKKARIEVREKGNLKKLING